MANSYSSVHLHLVFSTKNRKGSLDESFRARCWDFMGGIARENGATPLRIGGVADHVHVLFTLPQTRSVSEIVRQIKGGSSKWIKNDLKIGAFDGWQDGYAVFSVSVSKLSDVQNYIEAQKEHHRMCSFQEEYRMFLEKSGVACDEKYLWG